MLTLCWDLKSEVLHLDDNSQHSPANLVTAGEMRLPPRDRVVILFNSWLVKDSLAFGVYTVAS